MNQLSQESVGSDLDTLSQPKNQYNTADIDDRQSHIRGRGDVYVIYIYIYIYIYILYSERDRKIKIERERRDARAHTHTHKHSSTHSMRGRSNMAQPDADLCASSSLSPQRGLIPLACNSL